MTEEQEVLTAKLIRSLGISPTLKGFRYLAETIRLIVDNPYKLHIANIELYPVVADMFNDRAHNIEKAMHYAIHEKWHLGNPDIKYKLFSDACNRNYTPPTLEFIMTLADAISSGEIKYEEKLGTELS